MRIAIIGAGNVGGGLAGAATTAGHDVVLSANSPASAQETAATVGAAAAGSNLEAVEGVDLVVFAVPGARSPASPLSSPRHSPGRSSWTRRTRSTRPTPA